MIDSLPRRIVTWYGLPAIVRRVDDGFCDVALPGLALPHPSLVNGIIRRGLPADARAPLAFLHELGHLQTLPFLALPAAYLWRRPRRGPLAVVIDLLAVGAYWELASEGYVVFAALQNYVAALRRSRNMWAILFWPIMIVLGILPVIMHRRDRPSGGPRIA